ncbi:zinc finger (ccch type) motif-containing protein [Cystoisospora suis]|uniref:Zinc finger (Ccch type) motif-containing protein n=1 Tax=Cystoisospora suis TaxID=483139 RepID=A0A2C6KHH9_9APIC|nr:zinc finger (ccch type) motif-containing protein [Cystoisospora suis]
MALPGSQGYCNFPSPSRKMASFKPNFPAGVPADGPCHPCILADSAMLPLDRSYLTRLNLFVKFYKTKMCPFFKKKRCEWGPDCKFAHGRKELRSGPDLSKTKMCPSLQRKGRCEKGTACRFAHRQEELRATSDLYKTSLCYPWMLGSCPAGTQCRHAHGEAEQLKGVRRRMGNWDNPAAVPLPALTNGCEQAAPAQARMRCPLETPPVNVLPPPPSSANGNDEVEFCVRFSVPRGAFVRLNGLQSDRGPHLQSEFDMGSLRRNDSNVETFLRSVVVVPPDVPRTFPDYPSVEVLPSTSPRATAPCAPHGTMSTTPSPVAQPQPEELSTELLPKFLSSGLDFDVPSSERETTSPSSGASACDPLCDYMSKAPGSAPFLGHELRFLPSRSPNW